MCNIYIIYQNICIFNKRAYFWKYKSQIKKLEIDKYGNQPRNHVSYVWIAVESMKLQTTCLNPKKRKKQGDKWWVIMCDSFRLKHKAENIQRVKAAVVIGNKYRKRMLGEVMERWNFAIFRLLQVM